MQPDIPVVFVRHRWRRRLALIKELWRRRWIALHYEDKATVDPDRYGPKGRKALSRLQRYCHFGAIVAADYRLVRPSSMLIGLIPPGSSIKLWRYRDPSSEQTHIYKVVALTSAREVSFVSNPLLAAVQPRQGTIMRWPMAEECVRAIFYRRPMPWNIHSLHPGQLEVMCYEFLRRRGVIHALLLPIGRSLLNVDVVGIDRNGGTVFAQVTHASDGSRVEEKLARLRSYRGSTARLFFFGPGPLMIDDPAVRYVPLERVFAELARERRSTAYKMLERMLSP